jgi:hypothetical protein
MTAILNRQLLNTNSFDSGALGMLDMVVHQFSYPARYHAVVMRGGHTVAEVPFTVDEKSEAMQLDIDLAQAERDAGDKPHDCRCHDETQPAAVVSPKGYVLFHASSGTGYSVVVSNENDKTRFDSTQLGKGDLFALSLLEPAVYSLANTVNDAAGEIYVTFTAEAAKRIHELETRYVNVTAKKFDPDRIEVSSTQGLVFRLEAPGRIVIAKKGGGYVEERSKPVIRWKNPAPAK